MRVLEELVYFEYRYFRFIFNLYTGLFEPNYSWTDPRWSSVGAVCNETQTLGHVFVAESIFGKNMVEIKEKSSLQILVDEVLHPFFVFQIASIILWSLDDYYYYAACILLISVVSTVSTFVETKRNLKRMKELSRYSCQVQVWRDDDWVEKSSEDLVPGDIFQLHSSSPILPCDAVLLTGDCIVNESNLY